MAYTVGHQICKKYNTGWIKGEVYKVKYFVKYEDGDVEQLSDKEISKWSTSDSIEEYSLTERVHWIETSGCMAQSYARMLAEMVGTSKTMEKTLLRIYEKMLNIPIDIEDGDKLIGPWLWALLGSDEHEKLWNAKFVLEHLFKKSVKMQKSC